LPNSELISHRILDLSASENKFSRIYRGLELFSLATFALAQPLTTLLSGQPTFFIAHHTYREDMFVLLAILFLGPPLLLWLFEALSHRLHPWLGRSARLLVNVGLAGTICLLALRELPIDSDAAHSALALLLGIGFAVLYESRIELKMLFRALAIVPPIFAVLFFTGDEIAPLLEESDPGTRQAAEALMVEIEAALGE
jgi:hypothetical protein